MANKHVNVAVSGAAGQIGYALLFRIASGQMLGADVDITLRLLEVDVPAVMQALDGVAMELNDCAFPNLKNIITTSDANHAMDGANWAMLVGAAPRKAGMERADLLGKNGQIFTGQGRAINDNAADDARILVVGNPCNTNCLIAMNNAPDIPNDRFFAMTALDELRARHQLAQKVGVDTTEITDMAIFGNHSSTQYPDFYNAKVNGKPALNVINDEVWLQNEFIPTVQQRGAAIIKARDASSAASAANAAMTSVYKIVHDTPAGDCYSVAQCSTGEYGVTPGLIFSFPCRTENGKLIVQEGWKQNVFGAEKIQQTMDELTLERDTVKELGLIK